MAIQDLLSNGFVLQSSGGGISPEIFLWGGTALMFLGMLAFIWMGRDVSDPHRQEVYVITTFVPAIAFCSYLAMALGFGKVTVFVGGDVGALEIYWARYADWLFTTPLLLLDLALLAGASRATIGTLIGADVMMILTGVVAAVTDVKNTSTAVLGVTGQRIVWWGVSTAFLLVLLYFLLSRLSEQAAKQPGEVGDVFTTLRNLTAVLWILYPIVWIVGTEGALGSPGLIPLWAETAVFMVLDVTAKVGFGFILLRSRSALENVGADVGATAEAAD